MCRCVLQRIFKWVCNGDTDRKEKEEGAGKMGNQGVQEELIVTTK